MFPACWGESSSVGGTGRTLSRPGQTCGKRQPCHTSQGGARGAQRGLEAVGARAFHSSIPCPHPHPLSLQRGQPGPSTSLEGGRGLPWGGAALAGGFWQPPPSCLLLRERQGCRAGCAGQMCGRWRRASVLQLNCSADDGLLPSNFESKHEAV